MEKIVQTILKTVPDVIAIYLFGSYGTSHATPNSDLDLAVYAEHPQDPVALWNLAQEIARFINRDVDLVDLQFASTVFRYQIISTGRRIFCRDRHECDLFENITISMYLDFNETRKELLEDYG